MQDKSDEKEENEAPTSWSKEKIAKVIAEKLCSGHPGWEGVKANEILLENVSGFGGNQTYHMSRKLGGKVVTEVALHLVGKNANFKNQPYQLHIQKTATESFSAAGLSPKRLTEEDDNFFINEWIKDAKNFDENCINSDFAKKVGALLAKIHAMVRKNYAFTNPYHSITRIG